MAASANILTSYLFYKRKTNTFLDWLLAQPCSAGIRNAAGTFTTTREIIDCAERLPDKFEVPFYITRTLHEAIRARHEVSRKYKELEADSSTASTQESNDAHEAFISRLEQVLHILLSKTKGIRPNIRLNLSALNGAPQNHSNRNRFASLDLIPVDDENATQTRDISVANNVDENITEDTEAAISDTHPSLEDDFIGEWIGLNYFMQSLDAVLDQSNRYWTEAANGHLPICLAAWLSSAAFHEVGNRFNRADYPTLSSRFTSHRLRQVEIHFVDMPELQLERRRFSNLDRPPFHGLLQSFRAPQREDMRVSEAEIPKDISKSITPLSQNDEDSFFLDYVVTFQMIRHMQQFLAGNRAIAAIELLGVPHSVCEPLLRMIDKLFSNTELPIDVQTMFGLEMLLSSYKAYTWPDGVSAISRNQNCRIWGLRFALEVQASFSETIKYIEERPSSISAHNLEYLRKVSNGLKSYTREKRFDLYHQAPWTAGCHMVEILTVAMFEGLHMCCDTGYLCALLHLYNALRKTDPGFRHITLLDQLCEVFLDKLFLEVLPSENFSSHFRRAMGGSISGKESAKGNSIKLSRPIPGLSLRQTGSTRLSQFYDLHTLDYHPTADFWHLAFEAKPRWQRTTRREQDRAMKRTYSLPLTVSLEKIKENVLPEFNGPLPVARINYLAVFDFSAKSMEELCMQFSTVKEKKTQPDKDVGFQLVDSLLVQIVDHMRDNDKRKLLPYWRPVNNAKKFFNGLDDKLSLDGFLWKNLV